MGKILIQQEMVGDWMTLRHVWVVTQVKLRVQLEGLCPGEQLQTRKTGVSGLMEIENGWVSLKMQITNWK